VGESFIKKVPPGRPEKEVEEAGQAWGEVEQKVLSFCLRAPLTKHHKLGVLKQ
jgi:hypothetical protein